ncbi:uncharacterized protein [Coffea arabica]|uniref:Uncharacterized protein isoform X6 n=1 Tax=Coffea arabica TaxID=13443 RepID=A0ABM4X6D3_COFAR
MIATIFNKIKKIRNRENKKTHLPFGIFLTRIFRRFNVPFYGEHIDKGFYGHKMGVSYFKKLAVKTENQGWVWKKFKPVDVVIGETRAQNKKIEAVNELDEMGKCAAAEKLPVRGDKEELDDVVILSQQTRVGGSVKNKVKEIFKKVGALELKGTRFETLSFLKDWHPQGSGVAEEDVKEAVAFHLREFMPNMM